MYSNLIDMKAHSDFGIDKNLTLLVPPSFSEIPRREMIPDCIDCNLDIKLQSDLGIDNIFVGAWIIQSNPFVSRRIIRIQQATRVEQK